MTSWEDERGYSHPLMKCPFCGADVALLISQADMWGCEDIIDRFTVVCDRDKGGCGATCGYRGTREKAAVAWNGRTVFKS